jgi:hypothetical protein
MARSGKSCSICRFFRGLAFSTIGGGVGGFGALSLGLERDDAIIAAFFGALGLVLWMNRKREES